MPDSVRGAASAAAAPAEITGPRHSAVVRATHWITFAAFLALLVTGCGILISHPRFYWGETGNSLTPPLFKIPIPASRRSVPTGYGYTLPDQNGWGRYLHFESAWVLVLAGAVYAAWGLLRGHFRRNLVPRDLRLRWPESDDPLSYNPVQRAAYLILIFLLFPLVVWTGLAMSPAVASAIPAAVTILGGQQSARTLHFFVSIALVFFLAVHVAMVWRAGFRNRVRAMITGRLERP